MKTLTLVMSGLFAVSLSACLNEASPTTDDQSDQVDPGDLKDYGRFCIK